MALRPSDPMGTYIRTADGLVTSFLQQHMSFPEYIAATDAAFYQLIPGLSGESLPRLRALMLANHDMVMQEMARRTSPVEGEISC